MLLLPAAGFLYFGYIYDYLHDKYLKSIPDSILIPDSTA